MEIAEFCTIRTPVTQALQDDVAAERRALGRHRACRAHRPRRKVRESRPRPSPRHEATEDGRGSGGSISSWGRWARGRAQGTASGRAYGRSVAAQQSPAGSLPSLKSWMASNRCLQPFMKLTCRSAQVVDHRGPVMRSPTSVASPHGSGQGPVCARTEFRRSGKEAHREPQRRHGGDQYLGNAASPTTRPCRASVFSIPGRGLP